MIKHERLYDHHYNVIVASPTGEKRVGRPLVDISVADPEKCFCEGGERIPPGDRMYSLFRDRPVFGDYVLDFSLL